MLQAQEAQAKAYEAMRNVQVTTRAFGECVRLQLWNATGLSRIGAASSLLDIYFCVLLHCACVLLRFICIADGVYSRSALLTRSMSVESIDRNQRCRA